LASGMALGYSAKMPVKSTFQAYVSSATR